MKYYWCDFIVPVVMKMQKMKIPTILGVLLLAGTLSAGAQMNSDSLWIYAGVKNHTIGHSRSRYFLVY